MEYVLRLTDEAVKVLSNLQRKSRKKVKPIRRALGILELDPKHAELQTTEYESLAGPNSEKIQDSSASNGHRILWCFGPEDQVITVLAIVEAS